MNARNALSSSLFLVALSGCGTGCLTGLVAALTVTVRDVSTNAFIGKNARIIVRRGTSVDTLFIANDSVPQFIIGGPGAYEITVSKGGYRDFQQSAEVTSTGGRCSENRGVAITALLQRL